jgi:hypothetical protein
MEDTNDSPRGDYSISELRTMMTGEPPAVANADAQAVPAADGEKPNARTVPDSETDKAGEEGNRGADGKFKAAKPAEDAEPVTANVQKRIDKLVAKQREAERERDELKTRLAGNQESRPAQENAPTLAAATRPEAKNFDTYEAYVDALTDWKLEDRDRIRNEAERTRTQQEAERTALTSHAARVEQATERYPDYSEVMEGAKALPITREIHMAIVGSEHGPDIAYYLATNPDEVTRIAKLPSFRQIAELGKLEGKFEAPAAETPNHTTNQAKKPLPKPPANVGGTASVKQPDLQDPKIDFSTFKRLAQAGLRRNQ